MTVDFNSKKGKTKVEGTFDKRQFNEYLVQDIDPITAKSGKEGWAIHIVPSHIKSPEKNQWGFYPLSYTMNIYFSDEGAVLFAGNLSNLIMATKSNKNDLIEALEDVYKNKMTFFMALRSYWNQAKSKEYFDNPIFRAIKPKDFQPEEMIVTEGWDTKKVVNIKAQTNSKLDNDEEDDEDLPF